MGFDELVQNQYDLGNLVQKLISNFKKDPRDRKTSVYYTQRLATLDDYGQSLKRNHTAIISATEVNLEHDYFVKAYYDTIRDLIVQYTKIFENNQMELISDGQATGGEKKTTENLDKNNLKMELRKTLRNQRALMQAIQKNLADIMTNKNVEQSSTYYAIKAAILEKYMVDLAKNNTFLWESTDEAHIEDYTLESYYDLEAKVESAMIELHQHISNDTAINPSRRDLEHREPDIPLPRITLPKFSGSYMHWMEFKDLYTELVHNTSINDSKKMHYLSAALEGEAKNLIKHLAAVGSNYHVAWSILTSRYDNKRLLVTTLLNKLISQPTAKRDSASALKSLHDVTKECIHGLKSQGLPVQHWDAILVHIVIRKMDPETQTSFEQGLNDNRRLITLAEVLNFLERRFQSYEARGKGESTPNRTCAAVTKSTLGGHCLICKKGSHLIYSCKQFERADLSQRWNWVKDLNLCVNCLKTGHRADTCKSRHCTKCSRKHHTLMHNPKRDQATSKDVPLQFSKSATTQAADEPSTGSDKVSTKISLLTKGFHATSNYVLLGTARVKIVASNGQHIECRAILDSGSQLNLITDRLLKKLGGKARLSSISMEGVGTNETLIRHQTTICILSTMSSFSTELNVHIIPKIVSNQPLEQLDIDNWDIPVDIILADPDFNKPGRIDCLLGAELFFHLLRDGQIQLADNLPVLQNSVLGWIVAGNVETTRSNKATCGICTTKELEDAISKFWESEELPDSNAVLTEDELRCESHFLQNTFRADDGRFVVKLPLKDHPSALADSRGMAYERFKTIERRLTQNPELREQYISFMREYETLGHMTPIDANNVVSPHFFIPHHCVLRPDNITTKLRVVFDASAHKPTGPSLNDIMFTGPRVQDELFSILLRFRIHKFVLKTDVEKMYRQIWVHTDDRNLQLILWRENPTEPLKVYQLNTVTYGTRSAPYLATRCLIQLAQEYQDRYPYGSSSLRKDFYVDDGLIGADTIYAALEIQRQLQLILGGAGMKLKKWCSNNPKLLQGIAPEDQEVDLNFGSDEDHSTKTLGLLWLPKSDMLSIKTNGREVSQVTKRSISSDLARIYDPLGLVGPVIVTGKIQLQRVWQLKLDWDEELPAEMQQQWLAFKGDLSSLENTRIPRHVFGGQGYTNIELHAFADASEKAFGACVYVRTTLKDKTVKLNLLCSKSRVAPIKIQTIPRLELCAALLAAELLARVQSDLGFQHNTSYLWTDSQIVLSWIHNHPGRLPVYIAHRVVKLLRLTVVDQWRHVPSKQNPADVLSRGIKPREFSSCQIWLYGPLFLYQPKSFWPAPFKRDLLFENDTAVVALSTQKIDEENSWIYTVHSKNSFSYVQRVVGYVVRFTNNAQKSKHSRSECIKLTPLELDAALKIIVRQIQLSDFRELRNLLRKNKFVPKTNQLSSLTPFLDEEGIIRVGGRLSASDQQFDAIHQMILPGNDPLVNLLVEAIHREHYHCGQQALIAHIRQRFWPLKIKSLARAVIQRCVRCTRARPILYQQIMGSLPAHRVQAARPFYISGVDYCGPFWVHFKSRGKRPQKSYIAVFCCFASKAVHMELVTDLTTEAFIGALKRFIARRGHCKTLYCDNATNFVGARNQLQELDTVIYADSAKESIIQECATKGIEFHFIPPRAPHFGGLWEAAVKSAKHLLFKNVSTQSLTYEELETVVVEIEAILNSRPLIPSSSDANDFNAITPGHLLIGEPLTSSVDVKAPATKTKVLDRWQLVSELKHNFWQRWSQEYLCQLQQRHKWKGPVNDIKPNTLVIIKEDNLPVLQWPLGRIERIYKGDDDVVRVCDVKTQRGIFKRPVHRLAPLFPEEEDDQPFNPPEQSTKDKEKEPNTKEASAPVSLLVSIPLHRIRKTTLPTVNTSPSKRARLTPGLLLTIVTLLMIPLALSSPINITRFENKPGIYFEKLKNIKFTTSTWNLIMYFDLDPLKRELLSLTDGTSTLQKLCDSATDDTHCKFLINYFDHIGNELQSKFDLFTFNQVNNMQSTRRTKRGAMDIVGNIANAVFGVLDSNYASQMSETIDKLKQSDSHLLLLLKNQTSLVDSTLNIIRENQLHTQEKFEEIDSKISELLFGGNSLTELEVTQNILMLTAQMFIMVSELQWTHSSILDVLIDSHHGKINPLLITPEQLRKEILKIKSHLPAILHLPVNEDNLLEVYKLISVDGIVASSHVIFHIELPLADLRDFELLHLVPIAASINSSLSAVKMSTRFLAISPHRDEFVPMSQHQVDACLSLDDEELLCQNENPTYHSAATFHQCELDLFNNHDNPRCHFYTLEDPTIWYSLKRRNHWIYATLNIIRLNAACNDESYPLEINQTGLIQLRSDCIIKNDLITLKGHTQITTSLHSEGSALSMPLGWRKQAEITNISLRMFDPNIHNLDRIQQQLVHLHNATLSYEQGFTTNQHSLVISYAAILLVITVILITAYKWRTLSRKPPAIPVPAPRQHHSSINTDC